MGELLTGFKKHKEGRIHVRCRQCGRKLSNMHRSEFDPPNAVLVETVCEKHDTGCGGPEEFYYDASGAEIPFDFDAIDAAEDYPSPQSSTHGIEDNG